MHGYTGIVASEWSLAPIWAVVQAGSIAQARAMVCAGFMVALPFQYSHPSFTPFVLSSEKDEKDQTKEDHSPHCSPDDSTYRYLRFLIIATVPAPLVIDTVVVVVVVVATSAVI